MMSDTFEKVKNLIDEVLNLGGGAQSWSADTPLLGAVPQLDSMAVVRVVSEIERVFGFHFEDDEISADLFATLGGLVSFIASKTGAA